MATTKPETAPTVNSHVRLQTHWRTQAAKASFQQSLWTGLSLHKSREARVSCLNLGKPSRDLLQRVSRPDQKPTHADSKGGAYFLTIGRDIYGVHKNLWRARLYGREGDSGSKAALRPAMLHRSLLSGHPVSYSLRCTLPDRNLNGPAHLFYQVTIDFTA